MAYSHNCPPPPEPSSVGTEQYVHVVVLIIKQKLVRTRSLLFTMTSTLTFYGSKCFVVVDCLFVCLFAIKLFLGVMSSANRPFPHSSKQRHQLEARLDTYSDLYEIFHPNLILFSLCLLTGA